MQNLLAKTVTYIKYLIEDFSLQLSVHFTEELLRMMPKLMIDSLIPYNYHRNPYCIAVKGSGASACVASQKKLIAECKTDESYIRTCYAGVTEYICPVMKDGEVVGFVAVSGYRTKVVPDNVKNKRLWTKTLDSRDIPKAFLDCVIPPLSIMLSNLFEFCNHKSNDEYNMVLRFLNEYHTNVTLGELCKHFGRSKSHMSHMFKSENGMTIRAYCNNLKLEDSKKLLLETDISVTEVAFDVGFNDVSYFIGLFKKKYGISPLQYRKKALGKL